VNLSKASLSERFWEFLDDEVIKPYFEYMPRNQFTVMDEDWDTLLILDACRYDTFEQLSELPGTLGSRLSPGSYTGEFFEENFEGMTYHDTVYVTANPVPHVDKWCSVDIDSVFHSVINVWEDHWDTDLNTVRPEPVAAALREAHEEYPNKRIIGHFIQPHQPFIGETGQGIDERGMTAYNEVADGETVEGKKVWDQLKDGELSPERVRKAYEENLLEVLPVVGELLDDITGKVVVSSDHGNLFGEFAWPFPVRKYGHPPGIHTKKLITVPWLETPYQTRRKIIAEPPEETASEAEDVDRKERLEHLGYR
jgi:hypothetical protein